MSEKNNLDDWEIDWEYLEKFEKMNYYEKATILLNKGYVYNRDMYDLAKELYYLQRRSGE